jgi:hypothetical protein
VVTCLRGSRVLCTHNDFVRAHNSFLVHIQLSDTALIRTTLLCISRFGLSSAAWPQLAAQPSAKSVWLASSEKKASSDAQLLLVHNFLRASKHDIVQHSVYPSLVPLPSRRTMNSAQYTDLHKTQSTDFHQTKSTDIHKTHAPSHLSAHPGTATVSQTKSAGTLQAHVLAQCTH